jgi:hypothetical protein
MRFKEAFVILIVVCSVFVESELKEVEWQEVDFDCKLTADWGEET